MIKNTPPQDPAKSQNETTSKNLTKSKIPRKRSSHPALTIQDRNKRSNALRSSIDAAAAET